MSLDAAGLGCAETSAAQPCGFGSTDGGIGTGGAGGSSALDRCLEQAENDCETCACKNCLDVSGECRADEGCSEMWRCITDTGCYLDDCYLPDTCKSVLDSYGGLSGSSAQMLGRLYLCALESGCPCGGSPYSVFQ